MSASSLPASVPETEPVNDDVIHPASSVANGTGVHATSSEAYGGVKSNVSMTSSDTQAEAKKARISMEMREKSKYLESQKKQIHEFKQKAMQCIQLSDMAARQGITRRDVFQQVITKQRDNSKGCMTLPVTIAFVVLYCLSARFHEDITNVYLAESQIRHTFSGSMEHINTLDDVWSWISSGKPQPTTPGDDVVNTLFAQKDDYGSPLPPAEWSRVLLYNQVQGPVILKQYRDKNHQNFGKALDTNLSLWALRANATNEGFVSASSDYKTYRRLANIYRPELGDSTPQPNADQSLFEMHLFPEMSIEEIRGRIEYLRHRNWLDQHTEFLVVQALLLNGELGRPRLEQMLLKLSFTRGGDIFYQISMEALFLEAFPPGFISYAVDIMWLCVLLINVLLEFRNVYTATAEERLYRHLSNPAAPLEYFIIALGGLYLFCLGYQVFEAGDLRDKLEKVMELPFSSSASQSEADDMMKASNDLYDKVDDYVKFMSSFRTLVCWYNIILIFRFFIAFRVQPRLAVVTNTLVAVSADLSHFAVLFFPCFISYMVAGNLLFGRRMEEFATLRMSCGTMFRMLFENEYNWQKLSEEHFWTSAIWVWSYLVLVVFIMLNLILAIILDTYNKVRMETDSADTIFVFLELVAKRLIVNRNWIANHQLQGVITEMDEQTTMCRQEINEVVPDMTSMQAEMIFKACQKEMDWKAKADLQRPTVMKLAASVKLQVDDAAKTVTELSAAKSKGSLTLADMGLTERNSHAEALHMALRQRGHSRAFPGMRSAPGGYYPPLLPPSEVPPLATAENGCGEVTPVWLQDLRKQMEQLNTWMTALQWQIMSLQWRWQRGCLHVTEASKGKRASTAYEGDDATWRGPTRTKAGVWML